MRSSSVLLFSLALAATAILCEAQIPTKKKSAVKKKKKPIDELITPDSELGSDCYDSCYPNSTFLDAQGKIKNPEQYGNFTEHCGKTYLFSHRKVKSWEENWKICCSIGMMPVIYDNIDEVNCVGKEVAAGKIPLIKENEFWAGGFQHGLNNQWYWCTKDSPAMIEADLMGEFSHPPDKKKGDAMSSQNRVKSPYEQYKCARTVYSHEIFKLTNYPCDIKNLSLACESVEKYPEDLLPDKKCKARCETHNCAVNKTLFKPNTKKELHLKDRYTYGRWVSRCGRYFLFSNKTATYDEARKKCCSYGTSLVSIKTAAKRLCLSSVAKEYVDVAGDYWTSGSDADCEGNYRWCSVDRAFLKKEVQWAKGHPKSAEGDCVWVRTNKIPKSTSLYTSSCKKKKKYICEVRQSGTTVQAVQKECMELLGLTSKEVSSLKNTTYYTYKMKMVNGTLQEGNVMRLLENSNEKEDLDKGYDAIEVCKNENDPDNCESAYKMYKCGNERAPVIFGKMVFWEEVTSQKKTAPVEILVPRTCEYYSSGHGQKNLNLIKSFESGTTPEGGVSITGWNNKIWYKSQYNASHNFKDAFNYCGSLEMRLPSAKTLEDFQQMYDFMNGSTSDNFYAETQSKDGGIEKWCNSDEFQVPPAISADKFQLLPEPSILVSKKGGPKYTLTPVLKSQLATSVAVNHFFCEPFAISLE